jgi:HEAT repeat protein
MAGLTNRSFAIGTDSALAIVELGTNAEPAIPIFLTDLQNPNHFYRERAADALGKLHLQPALVVPALTNLLNDPTNAARLIAINSLGEFGPAARSAVTALTPYLTNSDFDVAAKMALRKIAPEVLTNSPLR